MINSMKNIGIKMKKLQINNKCRKRINPYQNCHFSGMTDSMKRKNMPPMNPMVAIISAATANPDSLSRVSCVIITPLILKMCKHYNNNIIISQKAQKSNLG